MGLCEAALFKKASRGQQFNKQFKMCMWYFNDYRTTTANPETYLDCAPSSPFLGVVLGLTLWIN